jgi:hypothetical protein
VRFIEKGRPVGGNDNLLITPRADYR